LPKDNEEVLDVKDACKLLKVCRMTLYKEIENNSLPAKKIGRSWRFSKKALLEWLENTHSK
jgi:excisionase family DNA binding protein